MPVKATGFVIFNALAFAAMLVVNYLATTLPLPGAPRFRFLSDSGWG